MRALLLRRTVFVAVLFTGFALIATAVHGMSGVDTNLQVAAARNIEHPTFVVDRAPEHRWRGCHPPEHRPDPRKLV